MQPHWIPDSNNFWFRKSSAPDSSTFVYVDPYQGLQQSVFEHDAVARALEPQGIEASGSSLPFEWIDISDGCGTVRFCAGGKKWQWTQDGILAECSGDIQERGKETLKPLVEEE